MLNALNNAIAGMQAGDLQMDFWGTRISREVTVPFPQVLDSTPAPGAPPFLPSGREGEGAVKGTSPSPLPGVFPAGVFSPLAGDLALDMGNFLVARAAYRMNARVISAASHELKVLTDLGK